MVYHGLSKAIFREGIEAMDLNDRLKVREVMLKAHSVLLLSLSDEILREVVEQDSTIEEWKRLKSIFFEEFLGK